VFFQAREASNSYYDRVPRIVSEAMDRFYELTGRRYRAFEYSGHPEADRVIVLMGSAAGAAQEAVEALTARGERVGLLQVRLFRPFDSAGLSAALPRSARRVAVLDRTKEPGATGEPLYQDVVVALSERPQPPQVIGGRYGLASKEFTPAMVAAVFAELATDAPRRQFTVGITDDVTGLSLDVDATFSTEPADVVRALFYGLGSDGTVGATRNTVKIIGEQTDLFAQGYFVLDSKKSGSMTVSHLRFGPRPIRSTYLVQKAGFVGCHQFGFLDHVDVLERAADGGTFLLNCPHPASAVWDRLPVEVQQQIIDKQLRFYVIDATRVAREAGLPGRVNTVLQSCFFSLAGVLPQDQAIAAIKSAILRTYGKRGETVLQRNYAAVDMALAELHEVEVPRATAGILRMRPAVPTNAPAFVQRITAEMIAGRGDLLPVSAMPVDGAFPVGTSQWERRNIAEELPSWDPTICIDCAKCTLVCPHAAIRMKVFSPDALAGAPEAFLFKQWNSKEQPGMLMAIQVAPDDCNGCGTCADYCPAHSKQVIKHKSIDMAPKDDRLEKERASWEFFKSLPEFDRTQVKVATIKGSQMLEPLFEFSGACAGCGETPYLKLLTQMYGDRILVANATGCSSIYGGNLPTTPWSANAEGRGPAWANSLFEDNAEFGLGMRLALDSLGATARRLLGELAPHVGADLAVAILGADQSSEAGIADQRRRVSELRTALARIDTPEAFRLAELVDHLVKKDVWIVGGDGWAYDIGYGGLDHVLASGRDVNILVLDTEVYSNTGGQASKATPRGAIAKFAAAGKRTAKKDLGLIASSYGNVYVAQVALGADNAQTVKAFAEAQAHTGPSLIIAYSTCIAHGIEMATGMSHQKDAVDSGYWPLYRFDPRRETEGQHPFALDSRAPTMPLREFAAKEGRYTLLARSKPELAGRLMDIAQADVDERRKLYEQMAGVERHTPDDAIAGNGHPEGISAGVEEDLP
jgi:pyruvate-ferredoxin/flavodoxin oxidoreductase